MFPKPQSGSQRGTPPQVASDIAAYIAYQHHWNGNQKAGARQLVRAVWEVHGTCNGILNDFLMRWQRWLDGLGIDPMLI